MNEIDKGLLDEFMSEIGEYQEKLFHAKGKVQNELFTHPEESMKLGLVKIDWAALRQRKFLSR